MASTDLIGAPERTRTNLPPAAHAASARLDAKLAGRAVVAPRPTRSRPVRSSSYYFAAADRYGDVARGFSVKLSVRGFLGGLANDFSADELAAMRARRDEYCMLAAAYRQAGRRRERIEKVRRMASETVARLSRLARKAVGR
ncbi:hypothetical protein [Streptomyces sp. NPDC059786]|uniref:hypothetical protein n=1 Tax=Streptomyces sp. NPDC059786 TaxID=3346946 RepID=UPI00365F5420